MNNERLEYLGDPILDAVVSDYLFQKLPDADEGKLTQIRARIVKRKNLDYLGSRMGIPGLLEQEIRLGNASKHLHGNILEAFIGAAYMDRGYGPTRKFIIRKIIRQHVDLERGPMEGILASPLWKFTRLEHKTRPIRSAAWLRKRLIRFVKSWSPKPISKSDEQRKSSPTN